MAKLTLDIMKARADSRLQQTLPGLEQELGYLTSMGSAREHTFMK